MKNVVRKEWGERYLVMCGNQAGNFLFAKLLPCHSACAQSGDTPPEFPRPLGSVSSGFPSLFAWPHKQAQSVVKCSSEIACLIGC